MFRSADTYIFFSIDNVFDQTFTEKKFDMKGCLLCALMHMCIYI